MILRPFIMAAARLRTLVLLVDRDDKRLDELTSEVEQRLNEAEVERGEVRDEGAIKETTLHHKGREICLIVLVNDRELVERAFPQHVRVLRRLDD